MKRNLAALMSEAARHRCKLMVFVGRTDDGERPLVHTRPDRYVRTGWSDFEALVAEATALCGGERVTSSLPPAMLPAGVDEAVIRWIPAELGGERGAFSVAFAWPAGT